jgi:hypothetical protein
MRGARTAYQDERVWKKDQAVAETGRARRRASFKLFGAGQCQTDRSQ